MYFRMNPTNPPPHQTLHLGRPSLILLLCLVALWGSAMWNAGFYNDDAVTSTWDAEARMQDRDIWTYASVQFKSMIASQGRFAPAYNFGITPCLLAIGDNLPVYRLWHFAWLMGAIASMAWLAASIAEHAGIGAFAFAALLALMHVTTYHDSLLSYGVVLPQVAVCGCLGLLALWRSLDESKPSRLLLASALLGVTVSILTSEFGLVFLPLAALLLIFRRPLPQAALGFLPFALVGAAYVAVTLSIKAPHQYEGTSFGAMTLPVILRTWGDQLSGTFPLSFALSSLGAAPLGDHWWRLVLQSPGFWIVLGCAWPVFFFLSQPAPRRPAPHRSFLLLFLSGLILILLPALLPSLSEKYQKASILGVAYMQSLLQFSGLAMILAAAWQGAGNLLPHRPRSLMACRLLCVSLLAGLFAINNCLNRVVVSYLNDVWEYPRQSLVDTLSLMGLPDAPSTQIVVDRNWLARWENPAFGFRYSGNRLTFIPQNEYRNQTSRPSSWYVSYQMIGAEYGRVFYAKIQAQPPPAPPRGRLTFVPGSQRLVIFSPDRDSGRARAETDRAFLLDHPPAIIAQRDLGPRRVATLLSCELPSIVLGQ